MLTLTEVHTYYGKSHILLGVSLEVQPGEVVGLLGRNGVGKSTTLKTIMGLVRPSGGHVRFEGREIAGTAPHRLAHAGLAWVPGLSTTTALGTSPASRSAFGITAASCTAGCSMSTPSSSAGVTW